MRNGLGWAALCMGLWSTACASDESVADAGRTEREPQDSGQDASMAPDAATPSALRCDPTRLGQRYRAAAGASTALADDDDALHSCFFATDIGSAENTLAVAADGTVLVAPTYTAEGTGILRSRDDGDSWQVIVPAERGGAAHERPQPFMLLDPDSERLFFATTTAGGAFTAQGFDLSISDDLGETFSAGKVGVGTGDWIKLIPAPPVTSTPADYPNVLYASSPAPISTPVTAGLGPLHQQVQRSLDGGETWQDVAGEQLSLLPVDHACPATENVIYGNGVATSDGALYIGLRRCTRFAVASSLDEGASWTVEDVSGPELVPFDGILTYVNQHNVLQAEPLAVDSDDNLYAVWADAMGRLIYSVSRDRAASWSEPVIVSAPELQIAAMSGLAVKEPGTLALAYYGSSDGVAFDGYVAETTNALELEPLFTSLIVNDDGPLHANTLDAGYLELLSGGDLIEIVQVRYAPSGDLWTAFTRDRCPGSGTSAGCEWDRATHATSAYELVIARVGHR
jgi:hypothetical protein